MIDYRVIADSIDHYKRHGFVPIETPWTVSKETSAITKPEAKNDNELTHNGKVLVASGEQSFLYLMIKGFLLPGKYQTCTPCFRNDSFDILHRKYFIKNELIITDNVNVEELKKVVGLSMSFFSSVLPHETLEIVNKTEYVESVRIDSTDIECRIDGKLYELGSYGIRRHEYLEWIYATGCAEPRLSNVRDIYQKWSDTKK